MLIVQLDHRDLVFVLLLLVLLFELLLMIQLMQEQMEHLVRLVDDLLDVSRIMRNKIELRRTASNCFKQLRTLNYTRQLHATSIG